VSGEIRPLSRSICYRVPRSEARTASIAYGPKFVFPNSLGRRHAKPACYRLKTGLVNSREPVTTFDFAETIEAFQPRQETVKDQKIEQLQAKIENKNDVMAEQARGERARQRAKQRNVSYDEST